MTTEQTLRGLLQEATDAMEETNYCEAELIARCRAALAAPAPDKTPAWVKLSDEIESTPPQGLAPAATVPLPSPKGAKEKHQSDADKGSQAVHDTGDVGTTEEYTGQEPSDP